MSNKSELIDLLQRLHEYMDDRSDADGDSEGYRPNEEMSLMIEIDDMLYALGVEGHGSHARAAVDPNYKPGNFEMNEDETGGGMDISVRMAIMSHLSDAMHDDPKLLQTRLNFIKSVVRKFVPKDIETTTDELDDMWFQISGSDAEKEEEPKYKLPGFDDTMDALDNLSIRKEEVNESIEKIKNNFKRFL